MKAARIHMNGGPEVLQNEEVPIPKARTGVDTARRIRCQLPRHTSGGSYKTALPATSGQEGAGIVEAVGPSVVEVGVGDRVVYGATPGNAEHAIVPARSLEASR